MTSHHVKLYHESPKSQFIVCDFFNTIASNFHYRFESFFPNFLSNQNIWQIVNSLSLTGNIFPKCINYFLSGLFRRISCKSNILSLQGLGQKLHFFIVKHQKITEKTIIQLDFNFKMKISQVFESSRHFLLYVS